MSMLAGPRRKQKVINLRAKNSAWSNDSNKFGQRMLEKMGWSSGKGLGAKENGIVEHVIAKYKNDDNGLGFEDKNDQWTKHEDDFNALLSNLSNGDNKGEKLHSGESLEVKSKKSKARVHYHKFTRGKDLTRYSEKDLANIFGKKSLKNQDKPPETEMEDEKSAEKVFTVKGSMEDYFKNKMALLKSKNKEVPTKSTISDDSTNYSFQGFLGTGDDRAADNLGFGFQAFSQNNNINKFSSEETVSCNMTKLTKSKKKKEKHDNSAESEVIENNVQTSNIDLHNTNHNKKIKRKNNSDMEEIMPIKKKKSKKNEKEKCNQKTTEYLQVHKKKKKKHVKTEVD